VIMSSALDPERSEADQLFAMMEGMASGSS
jgi:hypothetical protein